MASARWSAAVTKLRGPLSETWSCSTSPRSRLRLRPARRAALIMTLRTAECSMAVCRKAWSGDVKLCPPPIPLAQPPGAERQGDDRDRDAGGARAFGDDEIGDRADRGEIAGQCGAHRTHKPDTVLIGKPLHEGLKRE